MISLDTIHVMLVAIFVALLATAMVTDVSDFRIPNWISAAIAALFPLHVVTSTAPVAWLGGVAVAFGVFVAGAFAFSRGWVGGGDVKLLAAGALWAGPDRFASFLAVTALIGGLLALILLSPHRISAALAFDAVGAKKLRDVLLSPVLPYGVAIAGAGVVVLTKPLLGLV